MGIKLNWALPEGVVLDSVNVYRAVSKINLNSLPPPLVTLPGTAVEHDDITAVSGNIYYYVIAFIKGAEVSYSTNYQVGYFAALGPGPQDVLRGNWECGYMGYLTDGDFLSYSELKDQCSLPFNPVGVSGGWHKFIYKGKVLYFPNNTFTTTAIGWPAIYNAGVMFGDDAYGTWPAGFTAKPANVLQNKRASVGGFELKVRIAKPADNTQIYSTYASLIGSEIVDAFGRLFSSDNIDYSATGLPFSDIQDASYDMITTAAFNTSYLAYTGAVGTVTGASNGQAIYYRPVLELVM